jgi:hypothetical protein
VKIDLPIEDGYFNITPKTFCGIESYLITPQIDAKWNKNNLHLRSIVVSKEGDVLSSGFKKFFNSGEKPDCYWNPEDYNDWYIEEKLDGSLLIADYVNGQFSMRTRGTVSYKDQKNSSDFELLPERFPKLLKEFSNFSNLSLLFEIITPNNVIVIRPKEVEFYLLGAINKDNLEMISTIELIDIWKKIGCPPTPKQYVFSNIRDLSKIIDEIKNWKNKEGIVLNYNKGQNKVKIKSDWYCWIHRIKSQLNSENNLIEYYIDSGMPAYDEFHNKIVVEFDFEIAEQLKDLITRICNAGEKSKKYIDNMLEMVHDIRKVPSRKEQAEMIKRNYGENSAYAFSILDNKEIPKIQWFKLIEKNYER